MEVKLGNKEDILNSVFVQDAIKNKTPIIVSGEQHIKGKTSLKNKLIENGAVAFELWECLKIELID